MVFYRDLVAAALEVDPAAMLSAIAIELATFAMPGAQAPQFRRRAAAVARAGIYNMKVHREDVVEPLLRHWGVFELTDLPPAAEAAREQIAAVVAAVAPKPVNLLMGSASEFSVADVAALGVRRFSVGGALARAAWGGFLRAARAIAEDGRFDTLADGPTGAHLNATFGAPATAATAPQARRESGKP
jgi:hypothetical protein